MRFPLSLLMALVLSALVLRPAIAHHSSAAFDLDHRVTVKGTVTKFDWTNPHAFIYLNVENEKRAVEAWRVEGNSPNMLSRVGWRPESIKEGDVITVTGAPAKNGTTVMRLDHVVLANGQKLDGQGFNSGH